MDETYNNGDLNFEWDKEKDDKNSDKHNFSFRLATNIFNDSSRLENEVENSEKIYGEKRWITVGKVFQAIVAVVFTIRKAIRIISARPASKKERKLYNNQ